MRTKNEKIMDYTVNGASSIFFVAAMLGAIALPWFLEEGDELSCQDEMSCSNSENAASVSATVDYIIEP